jgi:hypothetical protein
MPAPPPKRPVAPSKKKPLPPPAANSEKAPKVYTPGRTFQVKKYDDDNTGEKILVYSQSGMGKTTLFALAPDPAFIPLDDGARKLVHPVTGERLNRVPEVNSFLDLRDALHSASVIDNCQTIVIDTITLAQFICEPFIFETIKKAESNIEVTNLEAYGYGKGYKHLVDHMRIILADLDSIVAKGKHVGLIAQQHVTTIKNSEGDDFLQDGPDLQHNNQHSVRNMVIAWCDHVVRISYLNRVVAKKKAIGDTTRAINVAPGVAYVAKSRTINTIEYPDISFDSPTDSSFWQFLLGDRYDS